MDPTQLAKRQERAAGERLVIQRIEEGFRVYAAEEPKNRYIVSGVPSTAQCTCPDFQYHRNDPDWQCKHVLAVLNECSDIEVVTQDTGSHEAEERQAIQEESRPPQKRRPAATISNTGNGISQLLLKRSVSPDGRIDSLSVEISAPVDGLAAADIRARAERMLQLQSGIVAEFLDGHERTNGKTGQAHGHGNANQTSSQRTPPASLTDPPTRVPPTGTGMESAVPATLIDVAGMNGKWGRRLFINVETNGKILKLFGKAEELVQHIRSAGYLAPEPFCEGAVLNIPCAVITKPSPDGRYTNVEHVLAANQPASRSQPVRRIGQ